SFTWKYLNYTVSAKGGDRQLLDNISGYIKPKTLTALMGSSVPDVDKFAYVERVIRLLELDDIADCLVGDPDSGSGISLAQRKLLSIGVEIVAKPKILFLDEPTSPCGEAASFRIISILRRLAVEEELTIILSLHQPSSLLFDQIDRLLLLVRGGHPVYFGDIGDDAHTLINYFERNGAPKCPPTANPAEYILDVVGASDIDWPQAWRDSPELHSTLVEIDRINQTCRAECTFDLADSARRFARSHTYQFHLVARRMLLMYWRNTDYLMTNLALQLIGGLVLGLAFLQIKSGTGGLLQMTYACFMAACLCVFTANQVIPEFIRQRRVFIRESATNQYGAAAFVCSCVAIELPFLVSTSTIFFVVFYFMTGFSTTSARVAFFWLQYIVLAIHSLTLGQAMSAISKTESVAAMLSPLATTVFALYSSALIPVDMLPGVWRYTLRWLSPYFYWLEAVVSDQLHDIQVRCRPEELFTFDPPANMTCGEYAGEWVKSAIGYIDNLDSASECRYCPYRVGDEYYQSFSWEYTHRWRNLGILLGFIAANIVITALAIKFIKYSRR
ncbi:ATP-binding cassette transporter snq2, partial [Coemansia sp. RSA 2706]